MRVLRFAAATFGSLVVAAAQMPVASPPVWSLAEAQAWHQLRAVLKDRPRFDAWRRDGSGVFAGYRAIVVTPRPEHGDAVPVAAVPATGPWCAVAWPVKAEAGTQRALLVHDDGTALVSTLPPDSPGEAPVAAVLSAASAPHAALLRQPGVARDGTRWQAIDADADAVAVCVVDENGQPVADVTLLADVVQPPDAACGALEAPCRLPLATATSDAGGMACLRGPRCEHVQLWLEWEGHHVCRHNVRFELANRLLRVILPTAARQVASERTAISLLKQIGCAQYLAAAGCLLDLDGDGLGEHAFLAELAGGVALRVDRRGRLGDATCVPPLLPPAFARLQGGVAEVGGYRFRLWLPGPGGKPVGEADRGGGAGIAVDARLGASQWCVYAWPIDELHGSRAFCYRPGDEMLFVRLGPGCRYFGDHGPDVHAAFAPGGDDTLSAPSAINAVGRDGQQWSLSTM